MTLNTLRTDEELAVAWSKRSDLAALTELRRRSQPMVRSQIARYQPGPGHIATGVFEAKADELMVEAAKSFNPTAGAAFKTHLFNHLRRLERFTKANANIAYVPEARANLITSFQTQMKVLEDEKRRPPTNEELADHMSLPVPTIKLMRKNLHREIPWSQVGPAHDLPMEEARLDQLFDDIYHELTPDERVVFEFITGKGRVKITQGDLIAKASGFSPAKVSGLRKRIADRLRPYLGSNQTVVA